MTDLAPYSADAVVVAGASGTVPLLCNPSPALNLISYTHGPVLSWTGIRALTYDIETTTNSSFEAAWRPLTNMV